MKSLLTILFLICALPNFGDSKGLQNNLWTVSIYCDNQFYSSFQTKIPAGTYTGAVNNIFWDANDVKYRFIGNCTTYFTTKFPNDLFIYGRRRVLLVFHGLDTFATINLNGHEIGKTSNMFTRYSFDIKKYLMDGYEEENLLNVTIESAVKVAKEAYENQSRNYIVYPKCVPEAYNGECHVNHIRKMQASFAWDWGPAIPSSGIWRKVAIFPVNNGYIMDYTVDVYQTNSKDWKVNVSALLELKDNRPTEPITIKFNVTLKNEYSDIVRTKEFLINDEQKIISLALDVPEHSVLRWWPNGFGSQHLYDLVITVENDSPGQRVTNKRMKRIGFRTVELIQEPLNKGLSFYFRINGVPIFAKGSNVIPISIMPENSTDYSYLRNLLWSAKEANMNMLRVWGGGVYESERFYEIADALGLMIWQDFMFACAMYPTTPDFLNSVKTEVVQNVWRLKSHPSVVIWAGNNENEAALYGNWYGTGDDQKYRDDYIKLYVNLIKPEVERLDPTRPFVVSSPSNGLWADENGWIGTDPYSTLYGDIHYYNYLADGWNINTYMRPRFASEYGFQSLPSIFTLEPVTKNPKADLSIDSEFIRHRQHLPNGSEFMNITIEKNLKMYSIHNSRKDFEYYIYLSQVNQAQSVKVQTESYRQARSSLNDIGEGYTMGALYWQLNDVWQAPSWSSIDINGRWKILHHYAKDFFAPIIVSPRVSPTDDLTIFIISDELQPRSNCSVEVNVHRIYHYNDDPKVVSQTYSNVSVKANAAYELTTIPLENLLKPANCDRSINATKNQCIIELILKDSNGETIAPPNYVYPTPPKYLNLRTKYVSSYNRYYRLTVEYAAEKKNGFRIFIETPFTLLFVWLDLPGYMTGRFSDNGFHILTGSKTIYFDNSPSNIDISKFTRDLKIKALSHADMICDHVDDDMLILCDDYIS